MSASNRIHPSQALVSTGRPFPILPGCVHYAGSVKKIEKSLELQRTASFVFDVCCDLEDGASRGDEENHFRDVLEIVGSLPLSNHRVGIRVHDYPSGRWLTEIERIVSDVGDRVAFITIPKIRALTELKQMLLMLRKCSAGAGLARSIPVHVLIETHGALRDAVLIGAEPEVEALELGIMDFIAEHHGALPPECARSPLQFEHELIRRAKVEIVSAALTNGCVPVHNVTLDFKSPAQAAADAQAARGRFGFLRMWSIHPDQIKPICEAMAPDFSQIQRSERILLEAQEAVWAPIRFEGELADRALYRSHWTLLQQAQLHGVPLSSEVTDRFFPQKK
ncbi:MAG: aldolase/citrate lyase family protein [Bdellovibrionota bacterium]